MTRPSNSRFLQTIPLVLVMVFLCPFAYSREIYVDDDGPADFDNIQAGIDTAEYGDAVCVAPGIYYENITMKNGINLLGAGADVTIIDANGYGDVVDVQANGVTISGFTLKNSGESDLWHMNCGVHVDGSYAPIIRKNVMVHNKIGIGLWDGANPDIRNNIIRNNYDGLYIYGSEGRPSNPAIINNTIVDNEMEGIILRQMVSPVIVNNIVTGHVTGINRNYVIGSPTLTYNNLWDNDVNYMRDNSIDDTLAGPGSISVDPLFADPNNGDFHLKSEVGRWNPNDESWIIDDITSPCIDAGDPNSPIGEEPLPNGGIINMGAYGSTAEAGKSPSVLQTKYSGGTGEPNDPYQIATAEDLMLLGESPEDYDKHFILTADIDLDPNLPGRKVFNKAVIAPDMNDVASGFQGTPFSGCFDGQRHVIHNLLIHGNDYLGLFGQAADGSVIANIGLEAVDISGIGYYVGGLLGSSFGSISESYSIGNVSGYDIVGGLAGRNSGCIFDCNSTSAVKGGKYVGGLVGRNYESIFNCFSMATVWGEINYVGGLVGYNSGGLSNCFSISTVYGEINVFVGGLVGYNEIGSISNCYSAGAVTGDWRVGGLVGGNLNFGSISNCYSTCAVTGDWYVGGLVGTNSNWSSGCISNCYSTGKVTGDRNVGGLMGSDDNWDLDSISNCFWDTQTSGLTHSEGGTGLSTEQMHYINTFLNAGWDCVDEDRNGTCDYWQVSGGNYPQLSYFVGSGPVMPEGLGTDQQPYLIRDASDLGSIYIEPKAHYRLDSSLDLSDTTWSIAVIPNFDGTFDGNGHIISNLSVQGGVYLGLFGHLGSEAFVYNLGLEIVGINGTGDLVGGIVGLNLGSVSNCYSIGVVTGNSDVGSIVGLNLGSVSNCFNTGSVTGNSDVGGLVGSNGGTVSNCYSTGSVTGGFNLGGLVGKNNGSISNSFWDIQTSGQINSDGGAGKTTAEMQRESTFTDAGWDFVDETANGTEDIWWILEGQGYPRLWWEAIN